MTPILVISVIVGLVFLALRGITRPGIMLALMWGTYAIEQVIQQGNSFFMIRSSFTNIALTVFTAAAVGRAFLVGKYKGFKVTWAHIYMVALVALCGLSYFWSISPKHTIEQITKHIPYVIAFAMLAPFCAFDQKQIASAVKVIIYFGGFVLVALALGSFGNRAVVLDVVGGKALEANPLAAATFGAYVTICSMFYLYSRKSTNMIMFGLHIAIALLGVYTIVRSGSRGQLIAMIAACFIWLPITARMAAKRSTIIAIILAVLIAYGSVFLIDKYNFAARWKWDFVSEASGGRVAQTLYIIEQMWEAGPMAWLVGLGNSASYKLIGGYPHNVPGEVLAEEGLIGFALYFAFMITVTIAGFKFMLQKQIDPKCRVNVGLLLTLFTFEFGLGLKQASFIGSSGVYCVGLCVMVYTQLVQRQEAAAGRMRGGTRLIMRNPYYQGSA